MADYAQVTQDVREGLSRITANKGDKSVELIMNEILEVLNTACEQHNIDKFEFIQAFYNWQERFSYRRPGHCLQPYATSSRRDPLKLRDIHDRVRGAGARLIGNLRVFLSACTRSAAPPGRRDLAAIRDVERRLSRRRRPAPGAQHALERAQKLLNPTTS